MVLRLVLRREIQCPLYQQKDRQERDDKKPVSRRGAPGVSPGSGLLCLSKIVPFLVHAFTRISPLSFGYCRISIAYIKYQCIKYHSSQYPFSIPTLFLISVSVTAIENRV